MLLAHVGEGAIGWQLHAAGGAPERVAHQVLPLLQAGPQHHQELALLLRAASQATLLRPEQVCVRAMRLNRAASAEALCISSVLKAQPGRAVNKLALQWVEATIYVARTEKPDIPAQAGAPGNSASAWGCPWRTRLPSPLPQRPERPPLCTASPPTILKVLIPAPSPSRRAGLLCRDQEQELRRSFAGSKRPQPRVAVQAVGLRDCKLQGTMVQVLAVIVLRESRMLW